MNWLFTMSAVSSHAQPPSWSISPCRLSSCDSRPQTQPEDAISMLQRNRGLSDAKYAALWIENNNETHHYK